MRILFTIFLFTAFAIRPAIQISTVLYYQLNIDYIVEKYCVNKERPKLQCNGKCYLTKQLQIKTQLPEDNNDNKRIVITEVFTPLFFQENSITLEDPVLNTDASPNWVLHDIQCLEVLSLIDHPPQYI